MRATILDLWFHDRGVELLLQPDGTTDRLTARGDTTHALAAAAMLPGDQVCLTGEPETLSRPWLVLATLQPCTSPCS